jgi:hypothetical protein
MEEAMLDINMTNNINFRHFLNLGRKRRQNPHATPVVRRINALLDSHGLKLSQLLKFVPSDWNWTLANIADDNRFLSSINTDVLFWFSETFELNRAWLEEASDQIHRYIWGYKYLPKFFRALSELGWTGHDLRMSILAEDYCTIYPSLQRYAIVFSLPTIEIESTKQTIYKHRLFETVWNYNHPPCVRDTKAVARWFATRQDFICTIPIIPVKNREFRGIMEGSTLLPTVWTDQIGGFDRFEDRVLYQSESVHGKETEYLDEITQYLESALQSQ